MAYHTLKTAHFNIHYDKSLQNLASRAAVAAENVYELVTSSMGWEVEGVTQIRIVDSTDYSNGLASPYRYPFIQLYAAPPDLDTSLQNNDDWLFSLILHEFTHEAHIQMQYGVARIYNTIFGDLYLPNSMQPTWFVEGLAVLMETYRTTRGRIRSSYYSMVMRTHALEGTFQDLAHVSNSTLDYPRGDASYIYGGMFMNYLRARLGEQVIFELCHRYAAKPIPYGLNRLFLEGAGVALTELYDDWTHEMRSNALAVQARIRQQGETVSEQLTFSGENKGQPFIDFATGSVIVPVSDGLERSAIFAFPEGAVGKKASAQRLELAGSDASVSMDDGGNLFYVRTAPYKENYRFRDLFWLPNGAREGRRLTQGARVREAAVSRSGKQMVLVTNALGETKLELMHFPELAREVLMPAEEDQQYYCPVFSPDGRTLAFIWRTKERVDVALMDLETRTPFYVTSDDAIEQGLRFSEDGRYLLFASEVTGVRNIFARDMRSGALKQVTNVVTGATAPALAADGETLYFLKYGSSGWDIHRTKVELATLPLFAESPDKKVAMPTLFDAAATREPYNPLPTFRPYAWEVSYSTVGGLQNLEVATLIEDAARNHTMNLIYRHEFSAQNPSFSAAYAYNGLTPGFAVQFAYDASEVVSGYLVNGVPAPWTRETFFGQVGLSVPLMELDSNHQLSVSYTISKSAPKETLAVEVDPEGDLPNMPTQSFGTGVRLGWSYSDLFSGPFSISREDGRALSLGVTLYHPAMGGDRESTTFYWGWREYRQAPWRHHVLAFEFQGQASISNPNHQVGIGAGGYESQDMVDAVLNEHSVGLPLIRGYRPGFISGDHYQALRLEYRFPLWRAQLAYETLPVFLSTLHGGVFSDNLLISYNPFTMDDYYTAVGVELVWTFFIGYHLPMVLRTGYARGLMDAGENEVIFVVGGTF